MSKFKGVSWAKASHKWLTQITNDGKRTHLGRFDSEEAAARKYDEAASLLGKPLNFASEGQEQAIKGSEGGTSKFKGVCWNRRSQKWKAVITIDGKKTHLGYFESEEVAALKYDETASLVEKPLNFASDGQEHPVGAASVGGNAGQKRAFDAAENSDDNYSDAEVESAGDGAGAAGARLPSTAGGPEGTHKKNNNKTKLRRRRKDGGTGATSAP